MTAYLDLVFLNKIVKYFFRGPTLSSMGFTLLVTFARICAPSTTLTQWSAKLPASRDERGMYFFLASFNSSLSIFDQPRKPLTHIDWIWGCVCDISCANVAMRHP